MQENPLWGLPAKGQPPPNPGMSRRQEAGRAEGIDTPLKSSLVSWKKFASAEGLASWYSGCRCGRQGWGRGLLPEQELGLLKLVGRFLRHGLLRMGDQERC